MVTVHRTQIKGMRKDGMNKTRDSQKWKRVQVQARRRYADLESTMSTSKYLDDIDIGAGYQDGKAGGRHLQGRDNQDGSLEGVGAGLYDSVQGVGAGLDDSVQGVGAGLDDSVQGMGAGLDYSVQGVGAGLDDERERARAMKQSFRWGVFSPEFGKKLAKPNVKSP